MAYRLVYSDFWTDPRVMEEFTPEDKFFYLYILTNPSTTSCGIYRITKKQMAFELGYSIEAINSFMDRFEKNHKLIKYNAETRELAIKNWGKYNLNRGGKPVMDCLSSELGKVKDKTLIKYVYENIDNQVIGELYRFFYDKSTSREGDLPRKVDNTYTERDTNTSTNTYTERDTNTEKNASIKENSYTNGEKHTNSSIDENILSETSTYSDNLEAINLTIGENITTDEKEDVHALSLSLVKEYEEVTGHIGGLNIGAVKIAVNQHGYSNVKKAVDRALEKGKLSMSYINGILRTWEKEGYPKEGEISGNGRSYKNNGQDTNEFSGFKPQQPRVLTDEERKSVEEELL